MKGDFSRLTFDAEKHFSRVLMQQGRVQVDANWNEQGDILLHYMRSLARDLIGPHGGPAKDGGFIIDNVRNTKDKLDFDISAGHYYVEGILCENPEKTAYRKQPHFSPGDIKPPEYGFLVYLDVWERHIAAYEDSALLEAALGGVDTASRAQVVWQVKIHDLTEGELHARKDRCNGEVPVPEPDGRLRAQATRPEKDSGDACTIEPDARYRGFENQLYRVEIHYGSVDETGKPRPEGPTFKFSRENGSVVFPIVSIDSGETGRVTLELVNLGRDEKLGLRKGDVVEIVDDGYTLQNKAAGLLKVRSIDSDEMRVVLDGTTGVTVDKKAPNHPLLRRWDQKAGQGTGYRAGLPVKQVESKKGDKEEWTPLDEGIEIQFTRPAAHDAVYRTGDYWLIPARIATGDIEWPKNEDKTAKSMPPRGIRHYYAPLGIIPATGALRLCRCNIRVGTDCAPAPAILPEPATPHKSAEKPPADKAAKTVKGVLNKQQIKSPAK